MGTKLEKSIEVIISLYLQVQAFNRPLRPLSTEDCASLENALKDISNSPMTSKLDKALRIRVKESLKLLLGIGTTPIVRRAPITFPSPFPEKARIIYDRFELLHWGAPPAESVKRAHSVRPPPDHPIFGKTGIMRGILLGSPESNAISFRLNEKFKLNANVYGHNGLSVGAWWPYQICALRDGAHGFPVAGIFSSQRSGAYSIVLSGKYLGLDKDRGELITYSDSKALENKHSRRPVCSNTTLAMKRSFKGRKAIRVLRGFRNKGSPWAVARGFRYDGLYTIIEEKERTNKAGGVYLCWKLKRNGNQPPLDLTRPTAEDLRQFDRIEEGYSLEE